MTSPDPAMLYAQNLHTHLDRAGFGKLRCAVRGDCIIVHYKKAPGRVRRAIEEYNTGLDCKPVLPVRLKKAKY